MCPGLWAWLLVNFGGPVLRLELRCVCGTFSVTECVNPSTSQRPERARYVFAARARLHTEQDSL